MQGIVDQELRSIGLSATEISRFKELLNAAVAHRRLQWEKMSPKDQEVWVLEYAELAYECGIDRVYAGMRKDGLGISTSPARPRFANVFRRCPTFPNRRPPITRIALIAADMAGSQLWSTPNFSSATKSV